MLFLSPLKISNANESIHKQTIHTTCQKNRHVCHDAYSETSSVVITTKSIIKIKNVIWRRKFHETVLLARQRWKKLRLGIWCFLNVFHFTPPLKFIFKLWWCFIIDFSFISSCGLTGFSWYTLIWDSKHFHAADDGNSGAIV